MWIWPIFFTDPDQKSGPAEDFRIVFTKKSDGPVIETRTYHHGYRYKALAHEKAGKNMIPYVIDAAAEEKGVFQHEGEEFIYVLEGRHELIYDGKSYIMEEGDSVYFDASVPHSGRAVGKKSRLLAVMYNYKRV